MIYFLIPFILYIVTFAIFPYKTLQITLRIIGKLIFNKKRIGYTIPKSGGALLIANHISHLDFILVALASKRKVYFVMYDKIYYHKAVHWILRRLNMIPIAPTRKNGSQNNLEKFNNRCQDIINKGGIVVIYPEGTVSRNGHLLEFKKGMEYIASNINAPIIPMHVYGATGSPFTFSIQKNDFVKFKFTNLRKRIIINVGKPLPNTTSAFQARQKVLELAAESAFYAHSNKYENFTNSVFKHKNDSTLFINNSQEIKAKQLKISTIEYTKKLKHKLKNSNTIIVSISDELILIQTLLSLSFLGKKSVLIKPSDLSFFYSETRDEFKDTVILSDTKIKGNKEYIDITSIKIRNRVKSKFMASLPFLFFRIAKIRRSSAINASLSFINTSNDEFSINNLSLTNINAFTESIANTHNINKYGVTLNLKNTYTPIGFLTKIALPVMKGLTVSINNEKNSILNANTLIGEQVQIDKLFEEVARKDWKNIHTIITDYDLNDNLQSVLHKQNTKIYKATGIEGVIGLLSINTPNYKGKDIAGKELKQDGNIPSTYGRPVEGVAVKIVNPKDKSETLGANQEGKVLVKGPLVMHPTHNAPFTWIDVNLRGYINQKGYLQLT